MSTVRILVDLQACQTASSAHRGVGRYSRSLFSNLITEGSPRDIYGLAASHLPHSLNVDDQPQAKILYAPPPVGWQTGRDFDGGDQDSLDAILHSSVIAAASPDIIHVSHVFEGFHDRVPLPDFAGRHAGQVFSATLYDIIPLKFPDHYFASETFERWYRHRLQWLRQADLLLSISEATRKDAIDHLGINPDRITTIHGGIAPHFKPVTDKTAARKTLRSRYGINRRGFILYVGGDEYRKNLQGAIASFAALPRETRGELQFVLVGGLEPSRKAMFRGMARDAGLAADDILFLGSVPEDDLPALYSTCDLFFFPSLYEGLGLPVIEAMACGAPVIGGNNSSIKEIIGRKDALFDPADPLDVAQAVQKVLQAPRFADDLRGHSIKRAKDFSWRDTAQSALAAFDEALRRKRDGGITAAQSGWLPRPRLAVLTPLPPARSGIADYNALFLPYLAKHFDIDLYVEGSAVSDRNLTSAFRIFDVRNFRPNAKAYDAILYEFGNSEFHSHMLPLFEEFPGVVGLHDAYLGGSIAYLDSMLGEVGRFNRDSHYAHGSFARHFLAPFTAKENATGNSIVELPCTKRILDLAIGLISHSPFNLEIARRYYPEGWRAPYRIIPQLAIVPGARSDDQISKDRASLGFGPHDTIVATFGHIAWTKCGDQLVDAFLRSPLANDEHCHLVFVGELAKDDFGKHLAAKILGSGHTRIKITGWLSEEDFIRYLSIADIAIQLRTKSRGGTPKGVLDCLSYGLPVILNDDASYKDYPDDAAFKLPSQPSTDEIAAGLTQLWQDTSLRGKFAQNGLRYVAEHHDPERCASQYAAAIHEFIERHKSEDAGAYVPMLAPHLASCPDPERESNLAAEFLDTRPQLNFARPRLLIDVSHVARDDLQTGIQRVVRETVKFGYCNAKPGLDTVAVVRSGENLVEATAWLASMGLLMPHEIEPSPLQPIEFRSGDHLLMLDSSWDDRPNFRPIFARAHKIQVPITTAIYDLLPITLPPGHILDGGKEWFENWVRRAILESDRLVCISKSVADVVIKFIQDRKIGRPGLKVGYWHLGSEIAAPYNSDSSANKNDPLIGAELNEHLAPYCLMVGTVEPRKNYSLALDVFELLWSKGFPLKLVIVGKAGWLVDSLLVRLRGHEQLNKRLFFFDHCSDAETARLYSNAAVLLFISKDEGFGLPLVEAANYGIPIICSDIPIFHEIAGEHATYIAIQDAAQIAREISEWWQRAATGDVPQSSGMPRLSWEESAQALFNVVLGQNWYWTKPQE